MSGCCGGPIVGQPEGAIIDPDNIGVNVQDEGAPIPNNPHTTMNFVGAGVVASDVAGVATITIPGGGGPLLYTVHVAKNGNDVGADGSVQKPFLTVQAAMEYAWTTYVVPVEPQPVPPFRRPCVFVNAGTYDDGDLVLPPQICVMGEGFNHSRIKGNWTIDTRWSNYSPPALPSPPSVLVPSDFRSSWINIGLFGDISFDFNTVFSNEGKLYGFGTRFAGNVTIAEKRVNPVSNSITFTACESLGDVTLIGIPTLLADHTMRGGTLYITQAIGTVFVDVDNIFQSSGGSLGDIVVTSLDPTMPAYDCKFSHFAQAGATLTINGVYSAISADLGAVPLQSLVTLAGGANLNQITRVNQLNWSGTTANRPPAPYVGQQYFDTTLVSPIWWDGAAWIISGVNVEDEGGLIAGTPHTTLNFIGAGVTATDAGGGIADITIPGGGSAPVGVTVTFAMSPYSILVTDDFLFVDTSGGPVSLLLPDPTAFGFPKSYRLIDTKGTFATNNATVTPFAAEKLEGLASPKAFQTAWGGWTIVTDQIDWYSF